MSIHVGLQHGLDSVDGMRHQGRCRTCQTSPAHLGQQGIDGLIRRADEPVRHDGGQSQVSRRVDGLAAGACEETAVKTGHAVHLGDGTDGPHEAELQTLLLDGQQIDGAVEDGADESRSGGSANALRVGQRRRRGGGYVRTQHEALQQAVGHELERRDGCHRSGLDSHTAVPTSQGGGKLATLLQAELVREDGHLKARLQGTSERTSSQILHGRQMDSFGERRAFIVLDAETIVFDSALAIAWQDGLLQFHHRCGMLRVRPCDVTGEMCGHLERKDGREDGSPVLLDACCRKIAAGQR
mmetsp:Transcript_1628/g.4461  ORF Transcript_1628/g.4461 Transcript_1628/m.4461 type:complete len:298 (+) Transcript_1628:251-1144(+)